MQLSKDYIVGLVDGEGSFTAFVRNIEPTLSRVRRVRIEPRFYVKLVEQDKEILEALKDYFGCGSVYFQKDTRQNHQNRYRYEVFNREDLQKVIVPFFKKNPLRFPTKQKDFRIFCELLEAIGKGEHLNSAGLKRLYRLKQQMH